MEAIKAHAPATRSEERFDEASDKQADRYFEKYIVYFEK